MFNPNAPGMAGQQACFKCHGKGMVLKGIHTCKA